MVTESSSCDIEDNAKSSKLKQNIAGFIKDSLITGLKNTNGEKWKLLLNI